MAILDEVFALCNQLCEGGWRELFLRVSGGELDLQQADANSLSRVLARPLILIDRSIPGFEDFSLEGEHGITAYSFSRSLLYHGLASPVVVDKSIKHYPSLKDLDVLENYIFSTHMTENGQARSLGTLKAKYGDKLIIATFATQYRNWAGSSHRLHADMNFSRTGIARLGTRAPQYDAERRSFWVGEEEGQIAALSSKYSAYLAVVELGTNIERDYVIMDKDLRDDELDFVVPLHKLFAGDECLPDVADLQLDFESYHRNEKLKKVHDQQLPGTIPLDSSYDQSGFPFVIDDQTKPGFLYRQRRLISAILIEPTPGPIVEPAIQHNKYVAFKVPKSGNDNRFISSFQIPAENGRRSPEYVNIRHTVTDVEVHNPETDIRDINEIPKAEFEQALTNGAYLAVDFVDRSADGYVKAVLKGDGISPLRSVAAYSVITALDFFPMVNQRDVYRWDRSDNIKHFAQGGVNPLSGGRIMANTTYPELDNNLITSTSVLSFKPAIVSMTEKLKGAQDALSYLPDGASDVFAPGWDISMDVKEGVAFHAAYGLGSPFPEDAKLCAALNSFWPAAAPDASRTFFATPTLGGFGKRSTAIPLTDEELGVHPSAPNGVGITKAGWDGEFGPFLELVNNKEFVNYTDIARSDYTTNAWKGKMHMDLLKKVTTEQMIDRMVALQESFKALPPAGDSVVTNRLWLVSFKEVVNWAGETDVLSSKLTGKGMRFLFVTVAQEPILADQQDVSRLRAGVDQKFECHFDAVTMAWKVITDPSSNVQLVDRAKQTPVVNLISHLV